MNLDCERITLQLVDGKKPKSTKSFNFNHITRNPNKGFLFYTDDAKQSLSIDIQNNVLVLKLYTD